MRILLSINILFSLAQCQLQVFQSIPFDPFRMECATRHGLIQLKLKLVESAGGQREDYMFTATCDSLDKLYPVPAQVTQLTGDREDCRWSSSFNPLIENSFGISCTEREYLAGVSRIVQRRVQLLCCKLRTRALVDCQDERFTKPTQPEEETRMSIFNKVLAGLAYHEVDGQFSARFCTMETRNLTDILADTTVAPTTAPPPTTTTKLAPATRGTTEDPLADFFSQQEVPGRNPPSFSPPSASPPSAQQTPQFNSPPVGQLPPQNQPVLDQDNLQPNDANDQLLFPEPVNVQDILPLLPTDDTYADYVDPTFPPTSPLPPKQVIRVTRPRQIIRIPPRSENGVNFPLGFEVPSDESNNSEQKPIQIQAFNSDIIAPVPSPSTRRSPTATRPSTESPLSNQVTSTAQKATSTSTSRATRITTTSSSPRPVLTRQVTNAPAPPQPRRATQILVPPQGNALVQPKGLIMGPDMDLSQLESIEFPTFDDRLSPGQTFIEVPPGERITFRLMSNDLDELPAPKTILNDQQDAPETAHSNNAMPLVVFDSKFKEKIERAPMRADVMKRLIEDALGEVAQSIDSDDYESRPKEGREFVEGIPDYEEAVTQSNTPKPKSAGDPMKTFFTSNPTTKRAPSIYDNYADYYDENAPTEKVTGSSATQPTIPSATKAPTESPVLEKEPVVREVEEERTQSEVEVAEQQQLKALQDRQRREREEIARIRFEEAQLEAQKQFEEQQRILQQQFELQQRIQQEQLEQQKEQEELRRKQLQEELEARQERAKQFFESQVSTQQPPISFCTRDIAATDANGLLIACGVGEEIWQPAHCPVGTACFWARDASFRLCCHVHGGN